MDTPATEPTAAPAPAQADTAVTTAVGQAVASGDMTAFRAARQAERSGAPLAPTPPADDADDLEDAAPATATADTPAATVDPPRQVSKRQQAVNDAVRDAVARVTSEYEAKLARLQPAPAPAAAAAQPPGTPATAPAAIAPTRPKPTEDEIGGKYPTYADFNEDLIDWKTEQKDAARDAQTKQQAAHQRNTERMRAFTERTAPMRESDPAGAAAFDARVKGMVPASMVPADQATFEHHIAEAIFTSADPVAMSLHLADPTELARLFQSDTLTQFYREIGLIEGRRPAAAAPAVAPPPTPKPVTSAPSPLTTLGNRPSEPTDALEASVRNDDLSAYRAEKDRRRIAGMQRGS